MKEALQNVLTRRSVRSFTPQPIPRETLALIAEAANQAPSAMNRQLNQYTVIDDPAKIARLAAAVGKVLGNLDYNFYHPTALILCTAPRDSRFGVEDCACAMENIFLAANALGIGSVWINQLKGNCDDPRIREVLTSFGVPADHVGYGTAALGFPAAPTGNRPRRADAIVWAD
ncbi:MAG: nitroreductase [Clostridiaceae bacterium]|nr:nitroreductase [Clostridiaceae bacterium]